MNKTSIRQTLARTAAWTLHHSAARLMLAIVLIMPTSATAQATDFITDVIVIGGPTLQDDVNPLWYDLVDNEGWTGVSYNLNRDAGGDYIYLLYKTEENTDGFNHGYITDFYIYQGSDYPDDLTYGGRTYHLVPYDGSIHFKGQKGDLNSGTGETTPSIHLYYTTDLFTDNRVVTSVTFDETQSGALGANGGSSGYDLNAGAGGAYIYMHFTTGTALPCVLLTSATGAVTLQNGDVLIGTGGADTHVTIADGATVTLRGVDITGITNDTYHEWAGITCAGNAVIILADGTTNNVEGGYRNSGIYVPAGKTLTIQGSGTLIATGRDYAAGIGGGIDLNCGNITIDGGTITATGGEFAAGIGSGTTSGLNTSTCGNISITGGTVTATGGVWGAGIGSTVRGSCGNISITGGTITAIGINEAAGIGSGSQSWCGNITIANTVTSVTATKGDWTANSIATDDDYWNQNGGTLTIGGFVTGSIAISPYTYIPSETTTYTATFNANGGSGTMANQTLPSNIPQNLNANAFTRPYYNYTGWNTAANGSGNSYSNEQAVFNTGNLSLYAQWTPINFNITYNLNGGSNAGSNPATYNIESGNITLAAPSRNNYNFDGWTWDGQSTPTMSVTIPHGSTGDRTFTANWTVVPVVEVPNGDFSLLDTQTLTGTGGNNTHITIADGATVTLRDVTINDITKDDNHNWAGITCLGDATIILEGTNTIKGGNAGYPGIYVPVGKTLTIRGDGSLDVRSSIGSFANNDSAAGIGCGKDMDSGNIVIEGGNITATGDSYAAGIGSCTYRSCGDITITGGNIEANGGSYAVGIGCGFYKSTCGNITITSLVNSVIASQGGSASGYIGESGSSTCGTVTISDALSSEMLTRKNWGHENDTQHLYHKTNLESADDWNKLAMSVADGWPTTGLEITMNGDFTVSTMLGTADHPFSGTFYGQGSLLTLNINAAGIEAAPFANISGATIRDLMVDGTLKGGAHCAGLVGVIRGGTNVIDNCVVSTAVTTSGTHCGGIVGHGTSSTTTLRGCVFDGTITGATTAGTLWGWSDAAKVTVTDCLDLSSITHPIGRSLTGEGYSVSVGNTYYTNATKATDGANAWTGANGGTHARSTATLPANIGEEVYLYGYVTGYASGLKYDDTYYMAPAAISLADNVDNDIAAINGHFADVTLSGRTLYKDGNWNTLCLPFGVADFTGTPLKGATVMELDTDGIYSGHQTGYDAATGTLYLYFEKASKIVAGKPYIVKWVNTEGTEQTEGTENILNPVFSGVTVDASAPTAVTSDDGKVTFVGSYAPIALTIGEQSNLFLGAQNALHYPGAANNDDGNYYVNACRAYFAVGNDALPTDMDNSGTLTITDVALMINHILTAPTTSPYTAADVTALANAIIGKSAPQVTISLVDADGNLLYQGVGSTDAR